MFSSIIRRAASRTPQVPAFTRVATPLNAVRSSWTTQPNSMFTKSLVALATRSFSSSGDVSGLNSQIATVLGGQWGDEGKGKLVDILAAHYDLICRFNGGSNAGHTLVVDGKKFAFHLLPCGMLTPGKINVIGNGVVLNVPTLLKELESLDEAEIPYEDRLKISDRCHLLFDAHMMIDGLQEGKRGDENIGTTKRGIGPCYSSKTTRNGIRAGELLDWEHFKARHTELITSLQSQYDFSYDIEAEQAKYKEYRERIKDWIIDTQQYVHQARVDGKKILAEGANAALLDLDFGTYPFVTSSSTTAGGVCTGLGIPPTALETVVGIVKAYTTRVGSGPFPTELEDEVGQKLRDEGHEYGTTTGRPRRCGWLDIPVIRYSHAINGYTSINITKLDVLSPLDEIKIGTHYKIDGERLPEAQMPSTLTGLGSVEVEYETMPGWKSDISSCKTFEELPVEAQNYLNRVEELVGCPVSWIGTGPARDEMATKGFTI